MSFVIQGARASTPDQLAHCVTNALLRPGVALARTWLSAGADLHLAASVGAPTGGGTYARLDGQFGRVPFGVGKIGQIAATRTPLVVRSIRGDEDWLANPGWVARQGIRAFLGYPLISGDELKGVLAVFDRAAPSDSTLEEVQFLADYAAARLADLRERDAWLAGTRAIESRDQASAAASRAVEASAPLSSRIVTRAGLRAFERETIETALAETRGRVFGPRGAAALLGMKPTTLASRIKALGIR